MRLAGAAGKKNREMLDQVWSESMSPSALAACYCLIHIDLYCTVVMIHTEKHASYLLQIYFRYLHNGSEVLSSENVCKCFNNCCVSDEFIVKCQLESDPSFPVGCSCRWGPGGGG